MTILFVPSTCSAVYAHVKAMNYMVKQTRATVNQSIIISYQSTTR